MSCVVFTNKKDPVKAQEAFEQMIKSLEEAPSADELKVLAGRFDIEESERFFVVDENGDPNTFDFMIEQCWYNSSWRDFQESMQKSCKKD